MYQSNIFMRSCKVRIENGKESVKEEFRQKPAVDSLYLLLPVLRNYLKLSALISMLHPSIENGDYKVYAKDLSSFCTFKKRDKQLLLFLHETNDIIS